MSLHARPMSLPAPRVARVRQASGRLLGHAAVLIALAAASGAPASQAFAQQQQQPPTTSTKPTATISGIVTDVATGAPVAGVILKVPGLSYQGQTNAEGRYSIQKLPLGAVVALEAQRVGYGPTRVDGIKLDQAAVERNLKLNANVLSLEAVTSAANADPQTGVKSPYATTRLDPEQMPVPSLAGAVGTLQGKVAGVSITSTSGQPGDSLAVQIRAVMSPFKNNSPLYVVDGVALTNADFTSADFLGLDIESIEVIRGAAAGAFYGSRAAGGVIAITTKRGRDIPLSTSQIEVRQEMGVEDIIEIPPHRQSHYFRQNQTLQWLNAAGAVVPKNERVAETIPFQDNPYRQTYDQVAQSMLANRSMTSRISISQASPATNLNISYSRNRVPGTYRFIEGSTQQNALFFFSHQIRDNLSLEASVQHSRVNRRDARGSFADIFRWEPDVNLLEPNPRISEIDFPYNMQPDSGSSALNTLYTEWRAQDFTKRQRTLVTGDVQFRPFNWLSLRGSMGYDKSDNRADRFTPAGLPDINSNTIGTLLYNTSQTDGLSADLMGSVVKDFGAFTTTASLKGHFERQTGIFFDAFGNDLGVGFKNLGSAPTSANRRITSNAGKSRINSGSFNLGLDYRGKYILDGLLLHEGNSRFGSEDRWADFYRVGGSWLLSSESWYPSALGKLTLAKLRASYGLAGTQPDFNDQYQGLQVVNGLGFLRADLGNSDLRPERKSEIEVGADFIWNNKISFQLTYARSTLSDAIVTQVAPAISGFVSSQENIGETKGQSIEAAVEGTWVNTRVRNRNFRWWTNVVASRSSSEISDLGRACYNALTFHYVCDGVAMTSIWGYSYMRSLEDLDRYAPSLTPYRNMFEVNDDGYLVAVGAGNHWNEGVTKNLWGTLVKVPVGTGANAATRTLGWGMPALIYQDTTNGSSGRWWSELGNSQPTFDFGLGNRFTYGNFSAYIHFRGAIGGDIWNDFKTRQLIDLNAPEVDQGGKSDADKKPIYYYSRGTTGSDGFEGLGIDNPNFAYDNVVGSSSWAKLGELQFTYSVNARAHRFLSRTGAERFNLALIGRDLYTFKGDYDGLDPETFVRAGGGYLRVDAFRYPPTRKFSAAVTVIF